MGHKKWVFGYGNNKDVGLTCGCEEVSEFPAKHACIIIAKVCVLALAPMPTLVLLRKWQDRLRSR